MRPLVLLRVEAQGEPVAVAAAAVAEVARVVSVAARGPAAHGAAAAEHGRGAGGPPGEHALVIVRARLAHARHLGLAERGGERGLAGDLHPVTVPEQVQAAAGRTTLHSLSGHLPKVHAVRFISCFFFKLSVVREAIENTTAPVVSICTLWVKPSSWLYHVS